MIALISSAYIRILFEAAGEAVIIVCAIMFIGFCVAELYEILRRKRFYDRLMYNLEELDKKYLLSEMVEEPGFYDGRILYDALVETNKSMNDTIGDYRRDNNDFRDFIELWVHEIKLPLAGLRLMCHNDENHKYLREIGRIDDYIENVLYYARSNSAQKDYIIKKTSLKKVFIEIAVRYREELQGRGISLESENMDVEVMTDGKWMSYMLSQLMANSIKYASEDREPAIKVYTEDLADKTILHFRDNGIGVSQSDLPHIFEKSFTGENGRTRSKATGMGLYLVKKLCDKLGHEVKAESVKDEYTEITISFGKDKFISLSE